MNTQALKSFKQSFKIVRAGNPRAGETREAFEVFYSPVTPDSLESHSADQVCLILNDALVSYGKRLIAENSLDWNYKPAIEDLTIQNLADELSKPSARGQRLLTKANISKVWGLEFVSLATTEGKSQAYITTMLQLAEEKFLRLTADTQNPNGKARVEKVIEFLSSLEFQNQVAVSVNERLVEILVESLEVKESQELSLDDLD